MLKAEFAGLADINVLVFIACFVENAPAPRTAGFLVVPLEYVLDVLQTAVKVTRPSLGSSLVLVDRQSVIAEGLEQSQELGCRLHYGLESL